MVRMMTYEYHCRPCGSSAELRNTPVDHPVPRCPVCGEPMSLVLHPAGLVFKGAGFYETDYKKGDNHD